MQQALDEDFGAACFEAFDLTSDSDDDGNNNNHDNNNDDCSASSSSSSSADGETPAHSLGKIQLSNQNPRHKPKQSKQQKKLNRREMLQKKHAQFLRQEKWLFSDMVSDHENDGGDVGDNDNDNNDNDDDKNNNKNMSEQGGRARRGKKSASVSGNDSKISRKGRQKKNQKIQRAGEEVEAAALAAGPGSYRGEKQKQHQQQRQRRYRGKLLQPVEGARLPLLASFLPSTQKLWVRFCVG